MTVKDIISGESEYIEFEQEVSKKSEVYMKTVVAFANGSGGKIVFGVEDSTFKVTEINQEDAFSIMDGITSAISNTVEPSDDEEKDLFNLANRVPYDDRINHEADRFFNYPYAAVEEALSNAVYHRAYDVREPIEVCWI